MLLQTDLNRTLEVTETTGIEGAESISSIDSGSSSESDDSTDDEDPEDPICKQMRLNGELKDNVKDLENKLKATNDHLITSNNLKVKLAKELDLKKSIIKDLPEKNDML